MSLCRFDGSRRYFMNTILDDCIFLEEIIQAKIACLMGITKKNMHTWRSQICIKYSDTLALEPQTCGQIRSEVGFSRASSKRVNSNDLRHRDSREKKAALLRRQANWHHRKIHETFIRLS